MGPKLGRCAPPLLGGLGPHLAQCGLGPCHIVLDGDPAPPSRKGHSPIPLFGPCLLWPRYAARCLRSRCSMWLVVHVNVCWSCSCTVQYVQFCTSPEVSDKSLFATFARTKPHDSQISMAVVSLLLTFNWTTIAFVYSHRQQPLAEALLEVPSRRSLPTT